MKWTARRVALAAVVRALQIVSGRRDAHVRAREWWNRRRARRRLAPTSRRSLSVRRLLVCKTEQRGDVLLAIPALRGLRAAHPGARLVVLGAPWSVEILGAISEVDEVIVLDHPPLSFESSRGPSASERSTLRDRIVAGGFDLAVDLSADPWTIELLAEAGIPRIVGPAGTSADARLHASVAIPTDLHRVEAMLAIAALAGASPGDATPRIAIPEAAQQEAARAIAGLGLDRPFVVVHPGGRALKRWPIERWVELVEGLLTGSSEGIVLLAGPDEPGVAEAFAATRASGRVHLWPGGSFLAVGELLCRSRLVVGNDSGVAHLAAAVGATTVTLFGPAHVSQWAPRSARGVAISTDESCSYPCWPAVYGEPCSHHRCLRKLSVDRVLAEVRTRLSG